MQKNFDNWNSLKKHLHDEGVNCFYHEREIWWCSLGINIGFEEDCKGLQADRPVLVVKALNKQLCWIVPMSTSVKSNPYYFPIGTIDKQPASIILSQMRPIDTKRFINRIGYIDKDIFERTKQAIKGVL